VNGRTRWIPYLLCLVLAVLALWPMSIYPGLFHRTPNTPLHLMVLEHLQAFLQGDVRDLANVVAADWPKGRPVRVIGWPLHLVALPLVGPLGTVAALNVSVLVSLVLSGVVFVWMLEQMKLGLPARCVGVAAWVLNPLMIGFLSNGQYENHVGWAFPLVWVGFAVGGIRGVLMLAIAVVAATFSSPYQAIPVAVTLVVAIMVQQRHDLWSSVGILVATFVACYTYFSGPQPVPGGECGPTSGSMPAVLVELFRDVSSLPMAPQPDRWMSLTASLASPVEWSRDLRLYDLSVTPTVGFLGFAPLVGGLIGLWIFRRSAWTRPIALAGLACWLLALGPAISVSRDKVLAGPMPWDVAALMPGIAQMGTTLRFMTGTAFSLVVGLALLIEWASRDLRRRGLGRGGLAVLTLLGLGAVGADWLYGTVAQVPMQATALRAPAGFDALPDHGAVLAVPVEAQVPPEAHLWMGAVHGHPVVGYCDADIEQMRKRYQLIDYAQGGGLPDPSIVHEELQSLVDGGVSYLAFVVPEPGDDRFKAARRRIARLMGPPDAQGDGVFGYRTQR